MSKKYQSYKRIHKYQHESDIEKGKIKKEQHNIKKIKKKQQNILKNIITSPSLIDDDILDEFEETMYLEKKEQGNAKTHKDRLKALTRDDKID